MGDFLQFFLDLLDLDKMSLILMSFVVLFEDFIGMKQMLDPLEVLFLGKVFVEIRDGDGS